MDSLYLIISGLLLILGVIGVFVSILPGPILAMAGIFLYGWRTNFDIISLRAIIIFAILTLFAIVSDYLASLLTAKRFDISKKALWGLFIGGIAGFLVFNVIGMIAGQFLGVFIGEMIEGKRFLAALKSGSGAFLGYVIGIIINFTVVLSMVTYFIIALLRGGTV